jgi:hypothetical protein
MVGFVDCGASLMRVSFLAEDDMLPLALGGSPVVGILSAAGPLGPDPG